MWRKLLQTATPPDGKRSHAVVQQYLYNKLPYDPVKDFAPVINVYEAISMIVERKGFGAKTLQELNAMARAKPDDTT